MRIALSAMSLLIACSSETSALSPTEKCHTVQSTLCDRAGECIHAMHPDCVTTVNFTSQNCDNIKSVAETYDACLDQIMTLECKVLFPGTPGIPSISPPAMCKGTFMH